MLCQEFENCLTDYLDGELAAAAQRAFAEHTLHCPICHDLLNEVKTTIQACHAPLAASSATRLDDLEARIILRTVPGTAMTCEDFEERLTDYLDGFLPAPLYHRWQRHAALCARCTELPGEVVRTIGACCSYIKEEQPLPAGLHGRILQATLGTTQATSVRAPFTARYTAWARKWLSVAVSPQPATVAMMALVAVLVGTTTISDDGSISGMYRASWRLAAQTAMYSDDNNSSSTWNAPALSKDLQRIADGWTNLVGASPPLPPPSASRDDVSLQPQLDSTRRINVNQAEGASPPVAATPEGSLPPQKTLARP